MSTPPEAPGDGASHGMAWTRSSRIAKVGSRRWLAGTARTCVVFFDPMSSPTSESPGGRYPGGRPIERPPECRTNPAVGNPFTAAT